MSEAPANTSGQPAALPSDGGSTDAQAAGAQKAKARTGTTSTSEKKLPADPFLAAKAEMREAAKARKLHLVDGDNVKTPTAAPIDDTGDSDVEASDGADVADDGADDGTEAEKEATWAQKLRKDLEAKTAEIAKFKEVEAARERDWGKAVAQAKYRIEDVSDERDHFKGLFEQARDYLIRAGMLEPMSVDLVAEQYERRKLERQLKRGTETQTEQGHKQAVAQHSQAISAGLNPLMAKYPELNPKKNPEAREFIESELARYKASGKFDDKLELRARRWVAGWRSTNGTQQEAAPAPKQRAPRPESSTLAGTANSGRPAKTAQKGLQPFLTKKQLIAEVHANRARQQR